LALKGIGGLGQNIKRNIRIATLEELSIPNRMSSDVAEAKESMDGYREESNVIILKD
jgi:hypothetical protein